MTRNTIFILALTIAVPLAAINWPLDPIDSTHALGNNWGEFQDYGTGPYFHNGIDVFPPPNHIGASVRAVAHGWIKAWGTIEADYHYRIAISDSSPAFTGRASGWLYAHIDPYRPHKDTGAEVQPGDTIGFLVAWPVPGFDHTHFARISDTGRLWDRFPSPTWLFTENPLLYLQPALDTVPPVFQDARSGQRFAFCRNNTNSYFSDLNSLVGDVDVVARCSDKTGVPTSDTSWDRLIPYKFTWSIRGSRDSVPPTLGLIFSGMLTAPFDPTLIPVAYKTSSPCMSLGDYDYRDYYFVVTNNGNGDSTIDVGDTSGCWHTADFPDDDYWVKVVASDIAGNSTADSVRVRTANGNGIAVKDHPASWRRLSTPGIARVGIDLSVSFRLPEPQSVRLDVFDAGGRLESRVFAGELGAGSHQLSFTPRTAGIHLLVLTTGPDRVVGKLTVVR